MHVLWIYLGLFLGVFLEGELVLLSAVIAAHHGHLDFSIVIAVAILSTLSSDLFYFVLGREKAQKSKLLKKWDPKLQSVREKFENNKVKVVLSYRFLYGFRAVTPIFLGMQSLSYIEFIGYSLAGILLWTATKTTLGWLFGELLMNYLRHIEKIEFYVIGGLLILGLVFLLNRLRQHRKSV